MPSISHKKKVTAIYRYFKERVVQSETEDWNIMIDHDPNFYSPCEINGIRPDFLAMENTIYQIIIGEAKAGNDFKTGRSENQIKRILSYKPRKSMPILFILCLPINQISAAKRLLGTFPRNSMTSVVIIDELSNEIYHD